MVEGVVLEQIVQTLQELMVDQAVVEDHLVLVVLVLIVVVVQVIHLQ